MAVSSFAALLHSADLSLPTGRPRVDSEKARTRARVPSTGGLSSLLPIPAQVA